MHDEKRKGEHSERGKRSRLTGGCFGPVLVRFLSIRRPAVAAAAVVTTERETYQDGEREGEYGRIESQDDARERRQETAGERDPRDANRRARERAAKHYAEWHECGGARLVREEERK